MALPGSINKAGSIQARPGCKSMAARRHTQAGPQVVPPSSGSRKKDGDMRLVGHEGLFNVSQVQGILQQHYQGSPPPFQSSGCRTYNRRVRSKARPLVGRTVPTGSAVLIRQVTRANQVSVVRRQVVCGSFVDKSIRHRYKLLD
jgi:hypothetical protein